jgi:hypothetical protein
MTDAELRIVAFLMTSDATRPADLPDWLLALLEGDREDELSHELITAASLLYARRLRPGIGLDAARARMADYAADPARLDDLCGRMMAFRLSCCFERLKRAGRFEDVVIASARMCGTFGRWRRRGRHPPDAQPEDVCHGAGGRARIPYVLHAASPRHDGGRRARAAGPGADP